MITRATKGSTMRIEVTRNPDGLHGGPEVWVRVLSSEVQDWPRIEAKLNEEDAQAIAGLDLKRYLPHVPTQEERAEHGYLSEDWWIFG